MKAFTFDGLRPLMGRLERGDDLLEGLERFCREHGVKAGCLMGIGALERAVLGFYVQRDGRYENLTFDRELEIASLTGNLSEKEGQPFVHAHLAVSDEERTFGGHLMPGCRVFACEFTVLAFQGQPPVRKPDPATGLWLW